jgi:hypothetical protein
VELQLHPCNNRSAQDKRNDSSWCMISPSRPCNSNIRCTRWSWRKISPATTQGSAQHYIVGCERPWNTGINSGATVPAILCLTLAHVLFQKVVLFLQVGSFHVEIVKYILLRRLTSQQIAQVAIAMQPSGGLLAMSPGLLEWIFIQLWLQFQVCLDNFPLPWSFTWNLRTLVISFLE